jgi:polyisoprenyl-phosphate glycosyltransferase
VKKGTDRDQRSTQSVIVPVFNEAAGIHHADRSLREATSAGAVLATLAVVAGVGRAILRLAGDITVQGWTSLAVIVLPLRGVPLINVDVLGEFSGRVHTEVRGRPLFLVRAARGFPAESEYHAQSSSHLLT